MHNYTIVISFECCCLFVGRRTWSRWFKKKIDRRYSAGRTKKISCHILSYLQQTMKLVWKNSLRRRECGNIVFPLEITPWAFLWIAMAFFFDRYLPWRCFWSKVIRLTYFSFYLPQGALWRYVNFLKILTQEGLIRRVPDCVNHFESCYYADNGILPVCAYTAQPLTAAQTQLLTEKVESITGKTVLLENRIDPECLGGVRLCYDGIQVDGTVKNRLDMVGKLLQNTVL